MFFFPSILEFQQRGQSIEIVANLSNDLYGQCSFFYKKVKGEQGGLWILYK